jgi:hypothetical protein
MPQRRAAAYIASAALSIRVGDRLPNISNLRIDVGVGAGTVQSALRQLQTQGALQIDTQKRRGTFLVQRDVAMLWSISDLGPLVIAMPLPSAWEFYGLASGLQAELDRLGVPVSMIYAHGSTERLHSLTAGRADIVVTSAFAADRQLEQFPGTRTVFRLPPGTYYGRDSVVVMSRVPLSQLGDDARIGIDPNSVDHSSMTEAEFPDRPYVRVSYSQLPLALRRGAVDAAVWHRSALWLSLDDQGLQTSPLTSRIAQEIADATSPAALIVRDSQTPAASVLRDIDLDRVVKLQSDVVEGILSPGNNSSG